MPPEGGGADSADEAGIPENPFDGRDEDAPGLAVIKPTGGRKGERFDPHSEYHMRCHTPYLRNCPICIQASIKRKQMRRAKDTSPSRGAKRFGDKVTVDFVTPYLKDKVEGLGNAVKGLLFYDLATGWLQFQPQTCHGAKENLVPSATIVGASLRI